MNWLVQKFVLGWLKTELDKIPGNGIKLAFGVVLLILEEIKKACVLAVLAYCSYVDPAIKLFGDLHPAVVENTAITLIVVGAVHKLLKWANPTLPLD